eukprot:6440979-Prymnesium_polylepis.2
MYEHAAEVYLARATLILTDRKKAPPSDLRPRTSGAKLKAVAQRCVRFQQRVAQERELGAPSEQSASNDAAAEGEPRELCATEIAETIAPAGAQEETPDVAPSAESPPPAEPRQPREKERKREQAESAGARRSGNHNLKRRDATMEVRRDDVARDRATTRVLKRVARSDLLHKKVSVNVRGDYTYADMRLRVLEQWPEDLVVMKLVGNPPHASVVEC